MGLSPHVIVVWCMSEELVGTMLPPELVDEVEGVIPTILPPEEVLELGSKAQGQGVSWR